MLTKRSLIGLMAILTIASCTSSREDGPSVGPAAGSSGIVREVVVENNVSTDIQVTAIVGSRQYPMGTVRAHSSRSLRVPTAVNASSFRLAAEPRGNTSMASRLYSEPIPMSEANQATWEIRSGISVVTYGRRGTVRP